MPTATILNNSNSGRLGITVTGTNVVSHEGSVLDLSGGGIAGGRGLCLRSGRLGRLAANALADANPGYGYSLLRESGLCHRAGRRHRTAGWRLFNGLDRSAPGIGEQITIPAGVPGLPAGTYTLLPANYALLPGAYRVEPRRARDGRIMPRRMSLPNGSYLTSATRGAATTAISDSLLTRAIVTPGATLRTYSQQATSRATRPSSSRRRQPFGAACPLMRGRQVPDLELATLQRR